jgi:hypothetical protein
MPPAISNFSIGSSAARRVVVPPALFKSIAEDDLRALMTEQRRNNDQLLGNVRELRHLIGEAFDTSGLIPERDRSGRVLRP